MKYYILAEHDEVFYNLVNPLREALKSYAGKVLTIEERAIFDKVFHSGNFILESAIVDSFKKIHKSTDLEEQINQLKQKCNEHHQKYSDTINEVDNLFESLDKVNLSGDGKTLNIIYQCIDNIKKIKEGN